MILPLSLSLHQYYAVPKIRWREINKLPGPQIHWFWGSVYDNFFGGRDASSIFELDATDMLYVSLSLSLSLSLSSLRFG